MKKITIWVLCVILALGMIGCGSSTSGNATSDAAGNIDLPNGSNKTALTIKKVFEEKIGDTKDVKALLDEIAKEAGIGDVVEEVNEGYLNGFSQDIKGFEKGYVLAPMIGSIPFVCYIFEVKEPVDFVKMLYENADPRWNICTIADEPVWAVSGNFVLFTMCPAE